MIRPVAVRLSTVTVPVNEGLADIAKVDPVPVWDAMEVAFPTDVIGPVKFAFVVTVVANAARVAVAALPEISPVIIFEKVWLPVQVGDIPTFKAGAASERMAVTAEPLTTERPICALGFAKLVTKVVLVPDRVANHLCQSGWQRPLSMGDLIGGGVSAVIYSSI